MRRMIAYLLALTCLLSLAGCSLGQTTATTSAPAEASAPVQSGPEAEIAQILGVDITGATLTANYASQDGKINFYKLSFSSEAFVGKIQDNEEWYSTPMTDKLTALAYGAKLEDGKKVGPLLIDTDGKALIPSSANDAGYYYFRNNDTTVEDPLDDSVLFETDSMDVVLAIYDIYSDVLFVATIKQ